MRRHRPRTRTARPTRRWVRGSTRGPVNHKNEGCGRPQDRVNRLPQARGKAGRGSTSRPRPVPQKAGSDAAISSGFSPARQHVHLWAFPSLPTWLARSQMLDHSHSVSSLRPGFATCRAQGLSGTGSIDPLSVLSPTNFCNVFSLRPSGPVGARPSLAGCRPDPSFFLVNSNLPSDRPGAVQGAKRTLDGENRSGIILARGKEAFRRDQ